MLVFFLLSAFTRTLWGKPLPPPLAPNSGVTANVTGVMACKCLAVPDDASQQLRSVYNIVQSCLSTIFACVWTSMHPNINGPRDSFWTCMKRRVTTALCAVIAPEMVLLWALEQRFAARRIAEEYNKEFKTLGEMEVSTWEIFRQLFQPLPKSTTRRGAKQAWTTTHGFFIQMGGFVLYNGEYPKKVLTYSHLVELLREEVIDAPTVTERDLQDKSKGDTISKGIVILQTSWFVLQCIVRAMQYLPLSELEVLTLAFAVMNGAIYAAWWGKPQGVDVGICIQLKQVGTTADNPHPAPRTSDQTDGQHSNDNPPPLQSNEHIVQKHSWLQRMLRKDREHHSSPVFFIVCLPYRIVVWMLRPLHKLGQPSETLEDPRMTMFYSAYNAETYGTPEHIAFVIGIIFGAIHLLGWTLEFSLLRDRILWQISSVVLTVAPLMSLLGVVLPEQKILEVLRFLALLGFCVLMPFYFVARFVVIALAFKAILHPPHNVLLDISWTRYIPHF